MSAAAELERLRKWRSRKDRDTSITSAIQSMRKGLRKGNRQSTSLLEAWDEFVPSHLAAQATIVSIRGGVLEVVTDGAAVAYKLNRLIRGGLLRELQNKTKGTLKKIRVRTA